MAVNLALAEPTDASQLTAIGKQPLGLAKARAKGAHIVVDLNEIPTALDSSEPPPTPKPRTPGILDYNHQAGTEGSLQQSQRICDQALPLGQFISRSSHVRRGNRVKGAWHGEPQSPKQPAIDPSENFVDNATSR